MDIVEWDGESFLVDSWQRAIVMNANTECPGFDGNFSGDDVAKERGLKYVVAGQCDSNLIQVANLGSFDSRESLLAHYQDHLYAVFQKGDYMIGNSVLYPRGICHSFVLLYCRPPGFTVVSPRKYLAGGLQSGCTASLTGAQYKLDGK